MRYSKLSLLVPCALLLSACTTMTPVCRDNGTRSGSCIESGPGSVAQQFYDYRIQYRDNDITVLRPHLNDNLVELLTDASRDNVHHDLFNNDPLSSRATLPDSASVADASTMPNSNIRSIPLRVELKQGDRSWHDEMLMTREDQCWVVDDIRYLGDSVHAPAGTLRQPIESR